jgi:hypothetical protein
VILQRPIQQAILITKTLEETMKIRSLFTLAGLAVSFAVPTIAQDKNAVAPEVRQQIEAVFTQFQEAYNKHDAAAMAALHMPRTAVKMPVSAVSKSSNSLMTLPVLISWTVIPAFRMREINSKVASTL